MFAYLYRKLHSQKYLISHLQLEAVANIRRINTDYRDRNGAGLMFYALRTGNAEMVNLVLQKGLPAYQLDRHQNSTIIEAYRLYREALRKNKCVDPQLEVFKALFSACTQMQKDQMILKLVKYDMMYSSKIDVLELTGKRITKEVAEVVINSLPLSRSGTLDKYALVSDQAYTVFNTGDVKSAHRCLYQAAKKREWSYLILLLDDCAKLDARKQAPFLRANVKGRNLLHLIQFKSLKRSGERDLITQIVDKYLKLYPQALKAKDYEGRTPLHAAIIRMNKLLMREYMKQGGYNALPDDFLMTPWDYCTKSETRRYGIATTPCTEELFLRYKRQYVTNPTCFEVAVPEPLIYGSRAGESVSFHRREAANAFKLATIQMQTEV